MSNELEQFIEEYNVLVIDEEGTAYFQLIHSGTEEVWRTFPVPAEPSKIEAEVANMSTQLATGNHGVRVQAISERTKQVRGQVGLSVTGRSAAAKASTQDAMQSAKAMQLHVEIMERQVTSSNARVEEAFERQRLAEQRAGESTLQVFEMMDMVNKFLMEKESAKLDASDREARNQAFITIAGAVAGPLSKAVEMGVELAALHMDDKKEEYIRRKRARSQTSNGASEPVVETDGASVDGARSPQH